MKMRLDNLLVYKHIVETRSQAENFIKLGLVKVNGKSINKPGYFVPEDAKIQFGAKEQYVSRAALKLASVASTLNLDFKNKTVLDVGSSTGGFTDYALQHGAKKVIAVDVGTKQLHPKLVSDEKVVSHEKTNILEVRVSNIESGSSPSKFKILNSKFDIIVIDVSFVSLRNILPHIRDNLASNQTQIIAMLKPQFEAGKKQLNKGVVKNSAQRREILHDFEEWCRSNKLAVLKKSDSAVAGEKGNVERFYLLIHSK
jgi:23S rRNA (cytidine1920-2'-O)/16S rRNA (cytidine1409-2'-O)-methyltransferase